MVGPLLYFDATGNIIGTLDVLVARDELGNVIGLVDFAAHEAKGGRLRDFGELSWTDADGSHFAAGAGYWPEWLEGGKVAEFRAEMDPKPAPARARIRALIHKTSGHRRERAAIEAAIAAAPVVNGAKDIRSIVGGPQRPIALDKDGRAVVRKP